MFTWIASIIHQGGPLGVFLLMALENIVPVIPSELIMPMAGYVAAGGAMSWLSAVVAGTLGSAIGAVVWYLIGRWIGLDRLRAWSGQHGRWLTLSPRELDRAASWFQRWGVLAVFIGRTLPGVRGVICIPAGVTRLGFARFFAASTAGSLIWSALLTSAGYALKTEYAVVGRWLNPIADSFVVLCLIVYLVRFATFKRDT